KEDEKEEKIEKRKNDEGKMEKDEEDREAEEKEAKKRNGEEKEDSKRNEEMKEEKREENIKGKKLEGDEIEEMEKKRREEREEDKNVEKKNLEDTPRTKSNLKRESKELVEDVSEEMRELRKGLNSEEEPPKNKRNKAHQAKTVLMNEKIPLVGRSISSLIPNKVNEVEEPASPPVPSTIKLEHGCFITFQAEELTNRPKNFTAPFELEIEVESLEICAVRCYQDGCTGALFHSHNKSCVLGYEDKHFCNSKPIISLNSGKGPETIKLDNACFITFQAEPLANRPSHHKAPFELKLDVESIEVCAIRCYQRVTELIEMTRASIREGPELLEKAPECLLERPREK
uniref:Apple domain-containing protein n=1 Tax=Meloidogyne javanica TaxID=6303 RepID=A0A915MXW3_MELJA